MLMPVKFHLRYLSNCWSNNIFDFFQRVAHFVDIIFGKNVQGDNNLGLVFYLNTFLHKLLQPLSIFFLAKTTPEFCVSNLSDAISMASL